MKNLNRDDTSLYGSWSAPDIAARLDEGERLSEEGNFEQAESIFREILDVHPDCSRACNDLACIMWQTRRHDEALVLFDKAIQQDPENIDAVWNYGQILKAMGRDRDACSVYRKYLDRHPGEAELIDELRAWQQDQVNPVD